MTASKENKSSGDGHTGTFSGTVHEEFKEVEEVKGIISNIGNIYTDQIAVEMAIERYLFLVDQYQEQPHLLDPHLEPLLAQLLDLTRDPKTPDPVLHLAYKLLYFITKTRGHKIVVRLMPHEVADLEPVLAMLARQDPADFQTWETRYMLLLWLSMVCMIPFDMVRLDSNVQSDSGERRAPIMERIMKAGQTYLSVSDKSRDAAAYMLSRFMTRPDVKKEKLPEFTDWMLVQLKAANMETLSGMTTVSGVVNTLALMFKHGKRDDMVVYGPTVLEVLTSVPLKCSTNTLLRKLFTKLVQRLGLTFLKAKVATWRYDRGSRSLAENLSQKPGAEQPAMELGEEEEEEYDIPDEMEEIIELLLNGLKDKDTVVRWSAAKGIGRVTGRLPQALADEVVGSIMELFTVSETDGAWHGACLSLAELGRRGLLVPERLPDVVPVIIQALNFDEKRGNFSVGAHVRDAACYVCWAFARAYQPEAIEKHVDQIATALLIATVFDREVNVRRAAAAAFQENVGRQGQFPHGIDILTTCDYFAVGNRVSCYTDLSVYIAQFPEYTQSLIDHLVTVKTNHWDIAIRELTALGLHKLTERAPQYMASTVLPRLVGMCLHTDLNLRHGALLATAEVTHALATHAEAHNKTFVDMVEKSTIDNLREITHKLQDAQLFRGLGGELMRKGVCCLIEKLSLSHLPYHTSPVVGLWQKILDDCLQHVEPDIQVCAVSAIPAFFTEYYKNPDGSVSPQIREEVVTKYLSQLQDKREAVRMGYSLAIGAFPAFFVAGKLRVILGELMAASTNVEAKFAEARRDAVRAITSICMTVGVSETGSPQDVLCSQNLHEVYETLFTALKDYMLDSRGDVGAWVREAAMTGLYEITVMLVTHAPGLLQHNITGQLMCHLVQQACEKIDRTRAHAGDLFFRLLYHKPEIPEVPDREFLHNTFPHDRCALLNWGVPSDTFPRFIQLLSRPAYTYHTLLGLTISVGGLTESLVKHSYSSLLTFLQGIDSRPDQVDAFTQNILAVFRDHTKVDRVTVPMMKMLDQLLAMNRLQKYTQQPDDPVAVELHALCKQEITRCGDVQKILASVDTFCGLLQFPGEVRKKTLFQLAVFLCHRFPIVRKTTATKLYEAMVSYDGLVADEHMDTVLTLLSDTQWDQPIDSVRPIRNEICDLLGVSRPVATAAAKAKAPAKK